MNTFNQQAAQGDILIRKIDSIPEDAIQQKDTDGQHIVAHSETGHHHTVTAKTTDFFHAANDPMVMFLVVNEESDLVHNRSFDTHQPIKLPPGNYEIRRQREYTPEGWRRVAD